MTVELVEVSVSYDATRVLHGVSLRVAAGSWLGLIGPNGAGKTTLLRAVAELVPHEGTIHVEGARVGATRRRALARLAAYVPQRPLVPAAMTVTDYVLTGRTPHLRYLGTEGRRDLEVTREVLRRIELAELADRVLGSLSGGEVQRALLGRALAQEARVLLLDEPTSALDVGYQQQALELVDALRREEGLTVIAAMHDLTLAGQFAERLAMLDGGRVVAEGVPGDVLTEERIRGHYGASVRVLSDAGGVVVAPSRAVSARPVTEAGG